MKQPHIKIGAVEMPLNDFVVSRNAILGITKSGKTFTAKGVAEQLMELGVPIIVFDAIGMWRFLKVPSGKPGGKGFPIVVAGGAQPDLPLNVHTAPQIVRAAIQQNISLVIDLYDPKLSKADWRRIVQDCFRILLFENKGLRHIFLEEAAEYVPQKVTDGQTYAEVEKLARMGGNASLGITFINPRAQELNKSVLELCDNIVLLRQRGTHAIDSLEKQMDKLSPDMAKEVALTMPNMTQGDCWVFTENGDKPTRTRSALIKSFHPDRRNPEANKVAGAAVNTDEFVSKLSGTLGKVIEEAKANDPAELKRRLAHAESELRKAQSMAPAAPKEGKIEIKEVPMLSDEERKRLSALIDSYDRLETVCQRIENMATEIKQDAAVNRAEVAFFKTLLAGKLSTLNSQHLKALPPRAGVRHPVLLSANPAPVSRRPVPTNSAPENSGELTGTQSKILDVIAMLYLRELTPNREMIAKWLGIHPNGGRYGSDLARLRADGFLDGCELTETGNAAACPLATGLDAARSILDGTQQNIIDQLSGGQELDREGLASHLGIHPNGGRFGSDLARLRTMGLIPERGIIKLLPCAFK